MQSATTHRDPRVTIRQTTARAAVIGRAATPDPRATIPRRSYTRTIVAIPLVIIATTLAAFLITAPGHEGVEGGPVDHNWGAHAWQHGTISMFLAFAAYHIRTNRKAETVADAWTTNPYAVIAWVAVVWGAAGFFVDGILTAFVGDDTTWTHNFALQATLQFPFMLGGLIFGSLALVRRARNRRTAGADARQATSTLA